MNDAGRPAGNARAEVVLLDEQRALSGAGALARDRHSIDTPADDHHVKVLAFQRRSGFYG